MLFWNTPWICSFSNNHYKIKSRWNNSFAIDISNRKPLKNVLLIFLKFEIKAWKLLPFSYFIIQYSILNLRTMRDARLELKGEKYMCLPCLHIKKICYILRTIFVLCAWLCQVSVQNNLVNYKQLKYNVIYFYLNFYFNSFNSSM